LTWYLKLGYPVTMLRTVLLALIMLSASLAGAEATRDPGQYFFEETFGNFQEELDLARRDGKLGVLIFFEQAGCPFCHRMKTTVLNQTDVQEYYRKYFRIFSVDINGDLDITDFQGHATTQKDFAINQYKVRATPVFAFFDLEGKLVARYTGPTRDAREFLWLGEYVAGAHYRSETFTQYKHDRELASGVE
jgi:thioredoxin-related protein